MHEKFEDTWTESIDIILVSLLLNVNIISTAFSVPM